MKIRYGIGLVLVVAFAAFKVSVFLRHYDTGSAINLPVNDSGAARLAMFPNACYRAKMNKKEANCAKPDLAAEDASTEKRVGALLERAVFDIEMQQLEEAKKDVDAALALDGKNADARHFSARIALTMGDIDRAEREVRIARELAPRDPRIGTTYAAILMGRKANREAIGVLGEVIHEYPNYLYARKLRATLYQYLGDCCSPGNYRVALEDYEYLIRHGAPDAGLLSQRAAMLISLGDPEPAISDLTTALVLQPDNQLLLKSRAEAYATVHRDALAVKDYDVLLAEAAPGVPLYAMLDEHRAKMLVGRAYSLVELKRFPEAVEDVVAAVSIGGKRSILRAQVLLRRHGFTDVPIDGQNSSTLRQALSSCFGLKACYQPVMREI